MSAFIYKHFRVFTQLLRGVVDDVHHILYEYRRIDSQKYQVFSFKNFNVGFYNSILASPLTFLF